MEIRMVRIFLFCIFGYIVFGVPLLPCRRAECEEPSAGPQRRGLGENLEGLVRGRAGGNGMVATTGQNTTVAITVQSTTILAISSQNSVAQTKPGQTSAAQKTTGQTTAGQTTAGQTKSSQTTARQTTTGQATAGQTSAAQPAPAQPANTTLIIKSINDWIQDVNTVNNFLDVALVLPLGSQLKAGASKALSFAQNEPTNNKILGAVPGLDASGQAAAAELDAVFGDVLVQLQNVVDDPRSLNTALRAVNQINVNRCKNVLPSAETLWRSAAVAGKLATDTWPPRANRERVCPGFN